MKRFYFYIFSLVCCICVGIWTSCSGNTDDALEDDGLIHLSADKTSIQANGADMVKFTVKKGLEDISDDENMNIVYTDPNGKEISLKAGASSFSTTYPGKYTFKAVYFEGGKLYSEETVEVEATAAEKSKYKHVLLGMQFTSEFCPNCPKLSAIIEQLKEEYPGQIVFASFHATYHNDDAYTIPEANSYLSSFHRTGLPQFIFNLHDSDVEMITFKDKIISEMKNELNSYPNTCGVAIDTKLDGLKLTVNAKITSDVEKEYRCLIYLVEDDLPNVSGGNTEKIHHHVVRKVATSSIGDRFPQRPLPANKEFTMTKDITLDESWNVSKMRVIVSMTSSNDGGITFTSNNTNECKVGESIDYLLND